MSCLSSEPFLSDAERRVRIGAGARKKMRDRLPVLNTLSDKELDVLIKVACEIRDKRHR